MMAGSRPACFTQTYHLEESMTVKIIADLIVFDLDGTLAATVPDIAAAANHACRSLGLPEHPEKAVQQMIGGGERNFIQRLVGSEHEDRFTEALELYLDYYSRHLVEQTRLYPRVKETLAALADKRLAVLSNKLERLSCRIVELLQIAPFFAAVKGGDSYGVLKPASGGLVALIKELGQSPKRTLMVGDKPADILSGRGAGAHTLAVTYGYGELESLRAAGPELTISYFPALQDHVF
jgi:phosphoglycolate phosphatase